MSKSRKKRPGILAHLIGYAAARSAGRQLRQFEKNLESCRQVQNDLLLRILRANAQSDFGRQHRFASIKSYADFIAAVPLTNFAYFAPFIERCKQGEFSALFGPSEKVLMFALTSGTTAAAKFIPVTEKFAAAYHRGWNIWGLQTLSDHPEGYLRKILQVASPMEEFKAPCGLPCGAISGLLARHQKRIVRRFYAIPECVSRIPGALNRYYTILRLALMEDIGFISTANPSTTLTLARLAEQHAATLIRDIHDGTLHEDIQVPADIRQELKSRFRPDPVRAGDLDDLLHRHGRLLPQHYWSVAFLANWTGGTLGLYLPKLNEYFGAIPIRDIGLLASEGRMSIPLGDNTPAGVLDITANFYEFVPAEEINLRPPQDESPTLSSDFTTLQASQLQKGQEYYVFLTNHAGLYRYNIGDMVRCVDHHGSAAVIEFLSKGAHISSLTGEKLTENQVVDAVRTVADALAMPVESFIMVPQWDEPPHYRLYVEASEPLPRQLLSRLAREVDGRLTVRNIEYDAKRESGRLGPIDVRQLPRGLLAQRDEQLIRANAGRSEQYKHRFLYNQPLDIAIGAE